MRKLVLLFIFILSGCGVIGVTNPKNGEIINKIHTPAKIEIITVHEHDPFTGNVLPKSHENILEPEKFEFEIAFGNKETVTLMVSRYDFSTYEIGDEYKFFPPKSPQE